MTEVLGYYKGLATSTDLTEIEKIEELDKIHPVLKEKLIQIMKESATDNEGEFAFIDDEILHIIEYINENIDNNKERNRLEEKFQRNRFLLLFYKLYGEILEH